MSSFLSISCTAASDCTAAGYYFPALDNDYPLIEHWSGSGWKTVPVPGQQGVSFSLLYSVSCFLAKNCMAVGTYHRASSVNALAEVWNGKTWSQVPSAHVATGASPSLSGVSCPGSSMCQAVGVLSRSSGPSRVLAERWDGKNWSVENTATPSHIDLTVGGVSCPDTSHCMVVGSYTDSSKAYHELIDFWDGKRWILGTAPNPPPWHG